MTSPSLVRASEKLTGHTGVTSHGVFKATARDIDQ